MNLVRIETAEQVEWLREQRNNPDIYKYFCQDHLITAEEHAKWWKQKNWHERKMFIVEENHKPVGFAGFDPISLAAKRATFTIGILQEFQGMGYGKSALEKLLTFGFTECNLSSIESEVLDYPGENRFDFYDKFGFAPYSTQIKRVKKNGEWIPIIRFYLTKDAWAKHIIKPKLAQILNTLKRKPGRPRKVLA